MMFPPSLQFGWFHSTASSMREMHCSLVNQQHGTGDLVRLQPVIFCQLLGV